jgi:hypothetical protein
MKMKCPTDFTEVTMMALRKKPKAKTNAATIALSASSHIQQR